MAIERRIMAWKRSIDGACLLGALGWVTALAPACTTTVVPFDLPVSAGGSGGARSGDASADDAGAGDAGAGDAGAGDASVLPTLPTSPSFDEAFAKGIASGNASRYVQVKCCASDGTTNCVSHVLGSTLSCLDPFSWKQDGTALCGGLGLGLFDYGVYGDCTSADLTNLVPIKASARFAEFQCCLDSSNCVKEKWGRDDLCFDEVGWNAVVKATCNELGAKLQSLTLYGPC